MPPAASANQGCQVPVRFLPQGLPQEERIEDRRRVGRREENGQCDGIGRFGRGQGGRGERHRVVVVVVGNRSQEGQLILRKRTGERDKKNDKAWMCRTMIDDGDSKIKNTNHADGWMVCG